MKRQITYTLICVAMVALNPAHAVEKTAVDRRLNAPLDVQLDSLRVFLNTLTGRLDEQINEIETNLNQFNDIVTRGDQRIELLRPAPTLCAHAQVEVPTPTTTQRTRWSGISWTPVQLTPWEQGM